MDRQRTKRQLKLETSSGRLNQRVKHFKYSHLDEAKHQIRLIAYDHDEWKVNTCDRNSAPPYDALSYTWGTSSLTQDILLCGTRHPISETLSRFLATRFARSGGWWWIDQISINQRDIVERNEQVAVMPSIYGRARKVCIWLDNLSEPTMEALNLDFLIPPSTGDSKREEKNRQAIGELSSHAHWSRLWTVQEAVLARNVEITYASGSISLEQAQKIVTALEKHGRAAATSFEWFVQNATKLAQGPATSDYYRFDTVVDHFIDAGCSDPRDKVFGIQGLLDQEQRTPIDYSKTTKQVLLDAVEQIIRDWSEDTPFRDLPSTCLRLGVAMLPKEMALHNVFDRLEPMNVVVRGCDPVEVKKLHLQAAFRALVDSLQIMT